MMKIYEESTEIFAAKGGSPAVANVYWSSLPRAFAYISTAERMPFSRMRTRDADLAYFPRSGDLWVTD